MEHTLIKEDTNPPYGRLSTGGRYERDYRHCVAIDGIALEDKPGAVPGRRYGGTMEPCGRLWPNGEFSVGYAPGGGLEGLETEIERAVEGVAHLGLALAPNSHREVDYGAPKRGTSGMTTYGRRLLRNAVGRMEEVYGIKRLSFITLTLPALEFDEFWNVSSNWSDILRVFYQRLGRLLESRGLPKDYAGCTELQPNRTKAEGVPALHIHFVVCGRSSRYSPWAVKPSEYRGIWADSCSLYTYSEHDWAQCENCQGVLYSAASYLTKYMAKGGLDCPPIRSDGTGWSLPTSWYNCSLALKRWVVDNTRVDGALVDMLEYLCRKKIISPDCEYFYEGVIEEMRGTGPHYFVGKLTKSGMDELTKLWWHLKFGGP